MRTNYVTFILLMVGLVVNTNAAPPQVSLDVTIVGNGAVTSDLAGIDCRAGTGECTEIYKKGTTVVLTANPDTDSNFLAWGGACAGTQPTCELKLVAPITNVTATFDSPAVEYPVPLLQTGQTQCSAEDGVEIDCAGTGQDGELLTGVHFPDLRFVDNGDGTVTDLATGLMWVQNRNCLGDNYPGLSPGGLNPPNALSWQQALDFIAGLNDGTYDCGTPPYTDWRLPNIREAFSTFDFSRYPNTPASPPFIGVTAGSWTSTSVPYDNQELSPEAYFVNNLGTISTHVKMYDAEAGWPARPFWIVRGP